MKFAVEEIDATWNIVSSVLHFGNIQYDDSTLDNAHPCTIIQKNNELHLISQLLGVNFTDFNESLLYKSRKIGTQLIKSELSKIDCISFRLFFFF